MAKMVRLKDRTEVHIRELTDEDLDRSLAFFRALPEEDRAYLRRDVTRREVIEQRLREIRSGRVKRRVAVVDDRIVAEGALEFSAHGWEKHVGELRLIVARPYQRQGLGILMARELYGIAAGDKLEEIVVRFMRPQVGARKIFQKLGFREDASLAGYARDHDSHRQDLILMRCDLEALWQRIEDFFGQSDWQRTR